MPLSQDYASLGFTLIEGLLISKLACYAYDCLLTLPLEVEAIWKSRPNATIILFLINRYAFMFNWVLFIVSRSIVTDINVSPLNIVLVINHHTNAHAITGVSSQESC